MKNYPPKRRKNHYVQRIESGLIWNVNPSKRGSFRAQVLYMFITFSMESLNKRYVSLRCNGNWHR